MADSQKIYRLLFWMGYFAVLVVAFLPFFRNLGEISLTNSFFELRLDYFLHFLAYFSVCMYYFFGRINKFTLFRNDTLTKFFSGMAFLAIVTELVQLWVPERSFNIKDMIANLSGLFFGIATILVIEFVYSKLQNKNL
jgi:VanZ family protein